MSNYKEVPLTKDILEGLKSNTTYFLLTERGFKGLYFHHKYYPKFTPERDTEDPYQFIFLPSEDVDKEDKPFVKCYTCIMAIQCTDQNICAQAFYTPPSKEESDKEDKKYSEQYIYDVVEHCLQWLKNPTDMKKTVKEVVEEFIGSFPSSTIENQIDQINSKTNCPTCGSEVTVGGEGCTHYYIPLNKSKEVLPSELPKLSGWSTKLNEKGIKVAETNAEELFNFYTISHNLISSQQREIEQLKVDKPKLNEVIEKMCPDIAPCEMCGTGMPENQLTCIKKEWLCSTCIESQLEQLKQEKEESISVYNSILEVCNSEYSSDEKIKEIEEIFENIR